jgi:hypothetical protein
MNKEIEKIMAENAGSEGEQWWEQLSYDNEPDAERVQEYLALVPDWLRAGFLGARKRYAKCSLQPYDLAQMSKNIAEQADKLLKQAELGFRMRVQVDLRTALTDCSIVYPKGW